MKVGKQFEHFPDFHRPIGWSKKINVKILSRRELVGRFPTEKSGDSGVTLGVRLDIDLNYLFYT